MKLISFLITIALLASTCAGKKKKTKKVKPTKLTIITGFVPNGTYTEVLRGVAPIYSDATASTVIGTFALACPVLAAGLGYDAFNPCTLMFYFHSGGTIDTTKDIIIAEGLSVIKNFSNLAEPPVVQLYPVTGGYGQYNQVRGSMATNFTTNPGLNTFQASLYLE